MTRRIRPNLLVCFSQFTPSLMSSLLVLQALSVLGQQRIRLVGHRCHERDGAVSGSEHAIGIVEQWSFCSSWTHDGQGQALTLRVHHFQKTYLYRSGIYSERTTTTIRIFFSPRGSFFLGVEGGLGWGR